MAKTVETQLTKILDEYEDEMVEELSRIAETVAKNTRKLLKRTSPRGSSERHYADGWSVKKGKQLNGGVNVVVYNRTKPQLTHLLEKGHAKVGGGRVEAIPHIAPAEKRGVEEFLKRVETEL